MDVFRYLYSQIGLSLAITRPIRFHKILYLFQAAIHWGLNGIKFFYLLWLSIFVENMLFSYRLDYDSRQFCNIAINILYQKVHSRSKNFIYGIFYDIFYIQWVILRIFHVKKVLLCVSNCVYCCAVCSTFSPLQLLANQDDCLIKTENLMSFGMDMRNCPF